MKVLIACIPNPANTYMADLIGGLSTFSDVTWDYEEFWACKNSYDIVHVHWPEYLSFEIENYTHNTDKLPKVLWDRIMDCLSYWHKNSTIVYTRHVRAPHNRDDDEFKRLYKTVFQYCTAITHFAEFSIHQFKTYFPTLQIPIHTVIPQHKHVAIPNNSTKESARELLNIDEKAKVLLSFGLIKENEKEIINKAFDAIPSDNKVLLAPGWKVQRRKIGYIRLRELVLKWEIWYKQLNKKRRIQLGFIQEEDAHLYCNAADVLFIPRTNELFSGNISLGFTFGTVVVGKNDSNIGEILKQYNNPTFSVNDDHSLSEAIKKAFKSAEDHLGEKNRSVARTIWSIEKTTHLFKDFYTKAIEKHSASN